MMKTYRFRTEGTCSYEIELQISPDGTVHGVQYRGGCSGNTKAVGILSEGRTVTELISLLRGIRCGFKPTSCPDQLAKAIKEAQGE